MTPILPMTITPADSDGAKVRIAIKEIVP